MSKIFKKKHLRYVAMILAIFQIASSSIGAYASYIGTENEIISVGDDTFIIEAEVKISDDLTLESEIESEAEVQESFVAEHEVKEYQELTESLEQAVTERIIEVIEFEEEETFESTVNIEQETELVESVDYGIYYGSVNLNNYLANLGRSRSTTSGSIGAISTPGDVRIYYSDGIHYTYAFQIITDGGTFTGHCSEPYKMAPRGNYPVYEITDENIRYTITNLLLLAPDGPLWNTTLCRNMYFGGNMGEPTTGYLYTHYVLGYLTGMTGYMSAGEIAWAGAVVEQLVAFADSGMIEGEMNLIGDSRWSYKAYIAQTGSDYQNIIWLEGEKKPQTGSLELQKLSSKPEITNGNANYSLEGAIYHVFNLATRQVLATIKLDANGYGRADNLPVGEYGVVEVEAPKGYSLNTQENRITIEADKSMLLNVYNEPLTDPIVILLKKVDSRISTPIEGAEFTIKFYDVQSSEDPALMGHTAKRTWVLKTDEDGFSSLNEQFLVVGDDFYRNAFGAITIPLGTITLQETKAPDKFIINDEIFVRQIIQGERPDTVVAYNTPIVPNTPFKGKVSLQKVDDRTNEVLFGAEFKIQEWSVEQNKYVDSSYSFTFNAITKTYESNDLFYSVDNQGKFKIVETKAPNGYIENWTQEFTLTDNNQLFEFTASNTPFNGKISIRKIDDETGKTLKGAEFKIYVWSEAENIYKETNEVMTYNNVTDRYESGTLYYTPDNLGKYKVVETKNPTGFFGDWEREITLNNVNHSFGLTATNKPIRGDVEIIKFKSSKDETYVGLEGVEFTFTDKETGEVVVKITTDGNGFATTASPLFPRGSLRYGTYIVTETVVPEGMKPLTPFEVTISEEGQVIQGIYKENIPYSSGIQLVKIDSETGKNIALAGTTFQILDKDKNIIEMTQIYPELKVLTEFKTNENGWCLLPEKLEYGTYYVSEINAPDGYLLGEDLRFVVDKDYSWENPLVIKIANAPVKGKVDITKVDAETQEKLAGAVFNIVAQDDVYTADGTLRASKGEIVDMLITDINGYAQSKELYLGEYYAEEKEAPFGYGLNLEKHEFKLVYENQETALVYTSVEVENFHSKIKTSAFDQFTGEKEGFAKEMTTLIDIVSYTDLIIGEEYVIDGFLMDFDVNAPFLVDGKMVTAQITFVPTSPDGEIELEFTFDGSGLKGKTIVIFETLSKDEKEVYVHHDINDKEQTVEYKAPEIGTTAINKENGGKTLEYGKKVTIVDIVSYTNLIVNREYVIRGILMDKGTGMPLLIDGKMVTSEVTFTPTTPDGVIELEFTLNTTNLAGKEIVVFEYLYFNELEIATHADIEDLGQTVVVEKPVIIPPKTGDGSGIIILQNILLVFGGISIILVLKKIKKYEKE